MELTLYAQLREDAKDLSYLKQKYDPLLKLVNVLIGVIPNCDSVMEIWPTSFKTYNLLVPNLLNLPNSLFGPKSVKKMLGLALYESSSAAGCNYCTAHCCSFALRRGLDEFTITGHVPKKEAAVINFSKKMSVIPCKITPADYEQLNRYCSNKEVRAISMGIVLMGFLNKFMDVMGIELEQNSINDVYDVLKHTDWSIGKHVAANPQETKITKKPIQKDNFLTYLKVILQAPKAIKLEKKWLSDVPKTDEGIREFINNTVGHYFPFLNKINKVQTKRAFAIILRDNFSKQNTKVGLKSKLITALIFFEKIENSNLKTEVLNWANKINIEIDDVFIKNTNTSLTLTKKEELLVRLTKKASQSPCYIEKPLIDELTREFSPEAIIEIVTWISILQSLHRLEKLPY